MVHFGNMHCMQWEILLGVILLVFLGISVPYFCCVCGGVFVCVYGQVGVSKSVYKGISPGGVDTLLQSGWKRSSSRCSKQPTSLETSPQLALQCTVQYLFIYFGWGANVCSVALDISDRKDQRATPQMKLSKWPDSWFPRRTSLTRTFYYDRSETSQQEGKRGGEKKKTIISPTREKEKETKRAPLYHLRPWWNELWMCGGD